MMLLSAVLKELRLLGRDRHGLAVLFIMPIAFMLIMSVAMSRDSAPHRDARVVIVGDAGNPLNQALVDTLNAKEIRAERIDLISQEDAWQRRMIRPPAALSGQPASAADDAALEIQKHRLRTASVNMVLHNPNPASASLDTDRKLQLFVRPGTDRSWLFNMKAILQQEYTRLRLDQMGSLTPASLDRPLSAGAGIAGPTAPSLRPDAAVAAETDESVNLKTAFRQIDLYLQQPLLDEVFLNRSGEMARPTSVQHSVPAWLIFGMFCILIPISNVIVSERQTNTLTRLRMAQAPAGLLLLSKLVPYFLVTQIQFISMILLSQYLLPMLGSQPFQLTGSLWPYAVLSTAISIAALGYGLLVSVLVRSTEQAVVLGGGGLMIMAALGGIMVPAHVMPESMQTISMVSPMSWALRAFHDLLLNHHHYGQIHHYVVLLTLFGGLCLTLATVLYQRQLRTQARI